MEDWSALETGSWSSLNEKRILCVLIAQSLTPPGPALTGEPLSALSVLECTGKRTN